MYKLSFTPDALKCLRKLDPKIREKIHSYLDKKELLNNPRWFGKALLYKKRGNWRYRVADYRIICKIFDDELLILILEIGHRKEIYK